MNERVAAGAWVQIRATVLRPEEPNFFPQAVAYGNNSALMAGWVEGGAFGIGGGMRLLLVTPG